jgi:hypothetical protein
MRFQLIENRNDFPNDGKTCWYWDTFRITPHLRGDGLDDYIAVQCYCDRDPNQYVPIIAEKMHLLFTDQAEYYCVCGRCYATYRHMQWSGSTFNPNWRAESEEYLEYHQTKKRWCEFCDPIFGNGGWR